MRSPLLTPELPKNHLASLVTALSGRKWELRACWELGWRAVCDPQDEQEGGEAVLQQMSNKKSSKKQEELKLEQQRLEEQQRHEEQRQRKEAKLKELAAKSSPLVDYELLDAYEFFLLQLAAAGIPQGNVYEFAAQVMLKFEKGKNKRRQQLREVERTNEEAVKVVSESAPVRSRSRVQRDLRPQLLPFKGELGEQELGLLRK